MLGAKNKASFAPAVNPSSALVHDRKVDSDDKRLLEFVHGEGGEESLAACRVDEKRPLEDDRLDGERDDWYPGRQRHVSKSISRLTVRESIAQGYHVGILLWHNTG